jgi:hypothetical protein
MEKIMKKGKKTLLIVIIAVTCAAIFTIGSIATLKEAISKNKEVVKQSEVATQKGFASIITLAVNTHNVLSDNKITTLPDNIIKFRAIETTVEVDMSNDDYIGAMPYVAFDKNGEAYVID